MTTKLGVWDVIKSVVAALFGVQSEQNRQRDFAQDSPAAYIVIGVVMIGVFVATLLAIVGMIT